MTKRIVVVGESKTELRRREYLGTTWGHADITSIHVTFGPPGKQDASRVQSRYGSSCN